jgi:hypothetical protein
MANRIQFRRDTSANWTRVNPVLEDGEPGLETDTNYIKYGDGNTAWVDLDYASTGGSGNALVNNDATVSLGADGVLTLPNGGTIKEGIVTSNPTIQLIPASPDVVSQKLVIKGGGSYIYTDNGIEINYYVNTAQVGDTLTFYVYSDTYADQTLYWWIYPTGANLATPSSGTVALTGTGGEFTILIDSDAYEFTVRVSPENNNYDPATIGVESGLINSEAPTYGGDHHLHLTTGDLTETSIFLGTDNHNVRTTNSGNIQITTPGESNNVWNFDYVGKLTLPSGATILESTYLSADSIRLKPNGGTSTQYLEIAPTAVDGNHVHLMAGSGTELFLGDDNQYVKLANTGGVVINSNNSLGNTAQWTFGTNGNLILPQTNMQTSPAPISWPGITFSDGTFQKTAATGNTLVNGAYTVSLDNTGTLTTPGNVTIGSGYGNISQIDTIFANNYVYANGVSILDGIGSNYGNTEVNTYLTNYDGDINFTSSVAIISNVDVITVLDHIRSPAYQYSNGVSILDGFSSNTANLWNNGYTVSLGSDGTTTFPDHGAVTMTGNLTVGNLTVNGNVTYINTETYVVSDNIPQFATGNPADTLDLGFVAHRTVNSTLQHTGLVRDSSAGNWKLFSNVTAQPGSTVDFANVVYDNLQLGTVYSSLISTTNLHIEGTAPSTNLGSTGDLEGDIRVDDNYVYYCTADWVASSWTVGWEGSTSNTLFLTKGAYPTPQVGWIVDFDDYGPWTIDTVTDNGTNWQITWVGATFGSPSGGTASLTNPNPSVIWKTVPLTAFGNVAYTNANVASYLTTYTGNIGNVKTTANVITTGYFVGNGALLTGIVAGSTYSNANVTSYLPTHSGNISGTITTAAQTNITTIGTLGNLSVTGNVTAGNVSTSGNVTAAYFVTTGGFGNISQVDTITANTVNSTSSIRVSGNIAVNGPAFGAYANTAVQTITTGTQQKVQFQVEEYDTNSNFANSRFTPTASGIYQFNAEVRFDGSYGTGESMIVLYKNGVEHKRGWNASGVNWASTLGAMTISTQAMANGTGDYFEIYVQQTSGGNLSITAVNNPAITWFNGCMLRGL